MHIQNNDITPANSQTYIWHPITNKLYYLSCWYYSVMYKKPFSQLTILVFFSLEKIKSPALTVLPLLYLTSSTHTKSSIYLANSLATIVSDPGLYRFLTSMYYISCPFCIALGCTKLSVQARGTCILFVTRPVFMVTSC